MSKIKLSKDFIRNTVKRALNEDLYPSGDITSSLIKNNKIIKVKLLSNENAIVGGLLFAKQAFDLIDSKIKFIIKKLALHLILLFQKTILFCSLNNINLYFDLKLDLQTNNQEKERLCILPHYY